MAEPPVTGLCQGLETPALEALCRQNVESCERSWADGPQKDACAALTAACVHQGRDGRSSFELTMPNGGKAEVLSLRDCFETATRVAKAFWPEAYREAASSAPPAGGDRAATEPIALPPAPLSSDVGDGERCEVKARMNSEAKFDPATMQALSGQKEPDINGDGVADLLVPLSTTVSWEGNSGGVCRRLLGQYFFPDELERMSPLKGEAQLNDRFFSLHALSVKRMEGARGNPWEDAAQSFNGGLLMAGAPAYLIATSGLLSLDRLADGLSVSDIATSQLASAFSVPVSDGGRTTEVHIGSVVRITFKKGIPERMKAFSADGNTVEARIIDFNLTFRKLPDGRMELAKEFVRVDIVPSQWWGEAWQVGRNINLFPSANAPYSVEVEGIPARLP